MSQQVQSLDKVIGFFTIYGYGGHLGHVTLKPLKSAEELLSGLCILFSAILVHLKKSSNKVSQGPIMTPGVGPYLTPGARLAGRPQWPSG